MTTLVSSHFTTKANIEAEISRAKLADSAATKALQADLIKKFVESPKTQTVRDNLQFLVSVHLLPEYEKSISAYLHDNPTTAPQVTGSTSSAESALSNLEASESAARHRARTELGMMGATAIPFVTDLLTRDRDARPANYRQVLGAVETLAEMPQAVRCKAYADNASLRRDVQNHAGISEETLDDAATRALACPP
jgi:hypothetical protein